jgi:uracil-DNA glycosylase
MQPRVCHLLERLGLAPRSVPASNVVFVRSAREADLDREKSQLLPLCWKVHAEVIERLDVRVVVCFGRTAGSWVREQLHAHDEIDTFEEKNERRWRSHAHAARDGRCVVTLTHPSIADWTLANSDPTPLVERALAR